ncbi:MAG: manganese efflux pump MntP family protein [Campylobacterales bacterium]
MFELILLAFALSMDAFAVAIGLGNKGRCLPLRSALKVGLFFGGFQALMPAIGFLAGLTLAGWIEAIDHWVAFVLLALIGAKMIYEATQEGVEEEISQITNRLLLILAIATSVDALAAGFTLPLLQVPFWVSIAVIGAVTFALSTIGTLIGCRVGVHWEAKAEILGGVILIAIGLKILAEHTLL